MKKIIIPIAVSVMSLLVYASCTFTTDPVFDKSASQRLNEAVAHAQKVLMEADGGWLVEYYPEQNQQYGGFSLLFKFTGSSTVEIRSELDPTISVESIYEMLKDRGPTVNFTSYNKVLHYFSDPALPVGGGTGLGYEGDYEFIVEKATPEEVILYGKKTMNMIRLTPFNGSWTEYCAKVTEAKTATYVPLGMTVNGTEVTSISRDVYGKYVVVDSENNKETISYMVTPTGIKFYEPLSMMGATMQNFTADTVARKLICSDAGINAEIRYGDPLVTYEGFLGTYTMQYTTSNTAYPPVRNREATVTIEQLDKGKTYYLKGLQSPANEELGNIVVTYNPLKGIEILGQALFTSGNTLWWTPWSTTNSITITVTAAGMESTNINTEGKLSFSLVNNGTWSGQTVAGFIFYYWNGTSTVGWGPAGVNGDNRFCYPLFEKQ